MTTMNPTASDSLNDIALLEPTRVLLKCLDNGQLEFRCAPDGSPSAGVRILRCFPWTQPTCYLSIRDSEGNELGLLESLEELDPLTRQLIEQELAVQEFLPRITRVENVDDRFDVMVWTVQTDRGPIELQVQHAEDVRCLDDGQVVIKDHAGGLFRIPDLEALDLRSRRLVEDRLA